MKIYNYTNIEINRKLLNRVIREFFLSHDLPRALNDEYGLYNSKQLIVVVKYNHKEPPYIQCPGKIEINCCKKCTSGFIFLHFIGGLLHEFLDELLKAEIHRGPSEEEYLFCHKIEKELFSSVTGKKIKNIEKIKCSAFPRKIDFPNEKVLREAIAKAIIKLSTFHKKEDISPWGNKIIKDVKAVLMWKNKSKDK